MLISKQTNLSVSDSWLCPRQKNFAKDMEFIANKRRSDYILSAVLHTIVKLYHERKKIYTILRPNTFVQNNL